MIQELAAVDGIALAENMGHQDCHQTDGQLDDRLGSAGSSPVAQRRGQTEALNDSMTRAIASPG